MQQRAAVLRLVSKQRLLAAAILIPLGACASGKIKGEEEPPPPEDKRAPELFIAAPERGTVLDQPKVIVRGRATDADSGVESVKINGHAAELAGDGSFEVEVPVEDGITMLETVARDASGKESSDRRAVLAGAFAPHDQPIGDALVARVGEETMTILADLISDLGEESDLGQLAQQFNPVVVAGGSCLGATVDVVSIDKSAVLADIAPAEGGVHVTVEIHDLRTDLVADYDVACLGGSAGMDLDADVLRVSGRALLGLEDGSFTVELAGLHAEFENFSLDVGAVPSSVLEFFVSDLDERVADMLIEPIGDFVPPMARDFLAEFEEGDWTVTALGRTLQIALRPTRVEFTRDGGIIAAETRVSFDGIDEADYVVTPADPPSEMLATSSQGLRIGVADDVANQVLAAFWASGEMDQSQLVPEDGPIRATLGDEVHRVDYHVLLPPMAQVNPGTGTARVTWGDLLVDTVNADGEVLDRFAASGSVELEVVIGPDLRVSVETGEPDMTVSILESSGGNLLNENQLEALGGFAIHELNRRVDSALKTLPIPTFADALLSAPSIDAGRGYVLLGADLEPAD